MDAMRYFGYVCPDCGKRVVQGRSAFALHAAAARVSCECGKSELRVELMDDRCRLYVPCGICGKTHRAECRAEQVLSGNGIALACPDCHQLICYVGEEYRVKQSMTETELLVKKEKAAGEEEESGEEAFLDNVIMYEVLSELKEIAARENGISCGCGSCAYRMEVRRSAVDLICRECGARLRIPAATDEDLDSLCCHLKLVIPGKKR